LFILQVADIRLEFYDDSRVCIIIVIFREGDLRGKLQDEPVTVEALPLA
jgi:hypothetical protein